MEKITLNVDGMSCGGCVRHVTKALSGVRGAQVEEVTVGSATVLIDPQKTSEDAVVKAVQGAGFEVAEVVRGL